MEDAGIGVFAVSDAAISGSEFIGAEIPEVPFYDFPIGKSLDSDYGIRGAKHGDHRLVMGRRRWR